MLYTCECTCTCMCRGLPKQHPCLALHSLHTRVWGLMGTQSDSRPSWGSSAHCPPLPTDGHGHHVHSLSCGHREALALDGQGQARPPLPPAALLAPRSSPQQTHGQGTGTMSLAASPGMNVRFLDPHPLGQPGLSSHKPLCRAGVRGRRGAAQVPLSVGEQGREGAGAVRVGATCSDLPLKACGTRSPRTQIITGAPTNIWGVPKTPLPGLGAPVAKPRCVWGGGGGVQLYLFF